jgi:MFS family permease
MKLIYCCVSGTFAYAGAQFGTVIAMPISGYLAASRVGWPSIFYLFGALAILWSIGFFFLGADSPFDHRSISEEEKEYIEKSLKITKEEDGEVEQVKKWLIIIIMSIIINLL